MGQGIPSYRSTFSGPFNKVGFLSTQIHQRWGRYVEKSVEGGGWALGVWGRIH